MPDGEIWNGLTLIENTIIFWIEYISKSLLFEFHSKEISAYIRMAEDDWYWL